MQTDHRYLSPEDAPSVPGIASKEIWKFKAIEQGIATISLEYNRTWDEGDQVERKFDLIVLVK